MLIDGKNRSHVTGPSLSVGKSINQSNGQSVNLSISQIRIKLVRIHRFGLISYRRSHILSCPDKLRSIQIRHQQVLRGPEIDQLQVAELVQEHVLRLQITVDNPSFVHVLQCIDQLTHVKPRQRPGEPHHGGQARRLVNLSQRTPHLPARKKLHLIGPVKVATLDSHMG